MTLLTTVVEVAAEAVEVLTLSLRYLHKLRPLPLDGASLELAALAKAVVVLAALVVQRPLSVELASLSVSLLTAMELRRAVGSVPV